MRQGMWTVSLGAGKDKEMDFHLEPPEDPQPYCHLEFSQMRLMLDSDFQTYKIISFVVLNYEVCENLFQQS